MTNNSSATRLFCALCAPFQTALLVLMCVWLPAAAADNHSTWIVNIDGYTPTKSGFIAFSALHIGVDGRVIETRSVAPKQHQKDTNVIDGRGRTMIPGLIDAHAHLLSEARLEREVNLVGSPTLGDASARIADYLEDPNHREGWVLGRGWNQVLWPGQAFPTAADLDLIETSRPVYLRRIDGHAGWANTRALALAGIDKKTPDPVGGRILRDEKGKATGVLIDAAMNLVTRHIPSEEQRPSDTDLLNTIARLNREGLTGVHQAGIPVAEAQRLDALYARSGLPIRLYLLLDGDADLDAFGAPWIGRHNDRLTVRAVKLYADGALGSRGAAMLEPYADETTTRGLLFETDSALNDAVKRVQDAGFQAGIHAIGDAGNRQALNAIEAAQADYDGQPRHRIEHAQILTPSDIPRLAKLGVIASMQPVHAVSDKNMAEDRIGPTRIKSAYAWRSLLDRGTVIASGSDFPVELSNPFHGLHAAIARRDAGGDPAGGWYRNEAMTRPEAVTSFTLSAAYAAHQEDTLGSLEAGKWADFLLLDRNIMTIDEQAIRDTRVLETWVSGTRVYAAPESSQ